MKEFEKTITSKYGKAGQKWLAQLPKLIDHCAAEWELTDIKTMPNLSYNYVARAQRREEAVVLKLNLDAQTLRHEAQALRAFAGHGVVQLLAEKRGALLLQHATPGAFLKNYFPDKDEESIDIFCTLMAELHSISHATLDQFPTLEQRTQPLKRKIRQLPGEHQRVIPIVRGLLETTSQKVLLHADLHHENILQHKDGWIAIDPKGIVGDPAYELAPFLCNPLDQLPFLQHASSIIQKRIKRFAHLLNIDEQRILAWCYVHAANGMMWRIEDKLNDEPFTRLLNLFGSLHP